MIIITVVIASVCLLLAIVLAWQSRTIQFQRVALIYSLLWTKGEMYGYEIKKEYEAGTLCSISFGGLYVILDRMEAAGMLVSRVGEATAERGGYRKKYFKIDPRLRAEGEK